MAQFVVNGGEVFFVGLDAHLYAEIVQRVDMPCARVANAVTSVRLYEERAFPERLRQWSKTKGGVKAFARLHHVHRTGIVSLQDFGQIVATVYVLRRNKRVDILPFLSPD